MCVTELLYATLVVLYATIQLATLLYAMEVSIMTYR